MRKKFLLMLTLLIIALGGSGKLFAADGNVAKVGNTEYATIDEAIAAWTNGTTLTLLADVTLSDVIQLSSTEMHTLDLGSYTMTAASKKDAIQIVNNGRSSASYALDIKAAVANPGGITATGKAVVRTTGKSGVKDRPIIRFYNGVFTGTNVIYHSGSNGTNCPQFQFHGGVFNGTVYANRALIQFYGGTFNGSLQMSVDSSAYALIAGGKFKYLSNLYGSTLNSEKFTIGSGKGVYDREVYIDNNGNYVIAAAEPAEGIEADVAKTPGTNDYLKYSKVGVEGQLPYTNVGMALKNNTSATVTVYVEKLDMTGINFKGTIVLPENHTVEITNAPANLNVQTADGKTLTPNANGEYTSVPPVAKIGNVEYTTLIAAIAAVQDGETITLIADETFTADNYSDNGGYRDGIAYSGDKSFTIDLDGHKIGQDGYLNDYLFWFKNVGSKENTITIKNGTLDAGTTAFCALCTASSHDNELTVNTEDVNLINNNSNGSTVKIRAGSVYNANAGTIITGKNSYLGIENWNATVNIYEGAEIYMNGTSSYNGCLVGVGGNGTVNVYGGKGKGVSGGLIAMTSGGTINVEGGEWIANNDGTYANSNKSVLIAQSDKQYNAGAGNAVVNVTGGTFKGGYNCYGNAVGDAQINISGGNFNSDPTNYVAEDYIAVKNNGVWNVVKAAAKIGAKAYASLEEAFKAATTDCTIEILSDVTVDYAWDARYTGGKFTVPVTINGNGKTIKFTASVNDNNHQAPFRFEADATVKNLTIDMSAATDNRFRAISSKGNLTVDNCKFIGKDESLNCRAIIFGEGAGANVGNLAIAITNSEFKNWKRGITDNENGQDVKNVTITDNTLEDAAVYVSATNNVTFTDNTVEGAYVDIRSYSADNALNVTATGNTLEENTDNAYNYIKAGGTVDAQEEFKLAPVAKIGNVEYTTLAEAFNAAVEGDVVGLLINTTLAEELTTPAGITIDGNGKQINGTISAGGNLTFVGHTKVTAFSASYYDRVITIGAEACLEVTGTGRVTLGYGNTFNITGTIDDAKNADKTAVKPSLIIPGGMSITGGNDATMNVTNAYVQIGSTTSKNSAANGTFNMNFTNSIVEFTNQFTFAEPTSDKNPTFNVNIKDCVLTTGTKFIAAAPNSNVVVDNSVVTLGTYFRNSGKFDIVNGSVFTGATIQFGENGGNNGTITVDASELTINATSTGHALDGKSIGSITLKNEATASIDYIKDMAIEIDVTSLLNMTELLGTTTVDVDVTGINSGEATVINGNMSEFAEDNITVKGGTIKTKNETGLTVKRDGGTWGGIDWTLTEGTLVIAPTTGTPVADPNCGKTYEVGAWREAVRYDSKGEGKAIEGWPYDRSKVKTLVIEEGVISIGSFAAQSFTNLTGKVVIPSTVKYIGQEAFQKSTMTELTFASVPAGVTGEELCIAQGAFKNLIIEEVSLPEDRPVHLHAWVFNNCHNLKHATMPATVVSVHGTNHIDYFKDFNAHSNPTWTKSSEIFAYNENMETVTFGSEEVMGMFYANNNGTSKDYLKANVGLVTYCDVQDAIAAAAESGNPISLIKNTNTGSEDNKLEIPAGETIIIDLKDKEMTGSILAPNANLTVKNGTIKNTNKDVSAIEINKGTLTIENVNINSARHALRIDGEVTATINGGEYTLNATSGTRHAVNVSNNAEVTIKAGKFVGPKGTTMDSGSAVCVQAGATVTIEGGDFSGGKTKTLGVSGTMILKGGTYDQDPSAYVAEKYMAEKESDDKYVVCPIVAKIGETPYASLQKAINAVQNGETITLVSDVTEDVVITQRADVNVVIDGKIDDNNNRKFTGLMSIDGAGRGEGAETLTIKNINFVAKAGEDSSIDCVAKVSAAHCYAHNVTIDNCTFTDEDGTVNCAAVRQDAGIGGGGVNWTIKNCTVDNTMHSLIQVSNITGVVVDKCTVESKNGINLNSSSNVEIKNSTIEVSGYAVRAGVNGGTSGKIELTDNTLKTNGSEDAVVVIRGTASEQIDLTMTRNVVSGTTHISGTIEETKISADANYWGGEAAPVVNGTVVKVYSYYTDEELQNLVISGLKGEGTEANPYLINNIADLKFFRDAVNAGNNYSGKFVKLTADIDLNNEDWTPIGTSANTFNGMFDGQKHTINNLYINDSKDYVSGGNNDNYVGLFGYMKGGNTSGIKNLNIHNVNITGCLYVGSVLGRSYTGGIIENCHVSGNISIDSYAYTGGIVGRHEYSGGANENGETMSIYNCSVKGEINTRSANTINADYAVSYVGGIVGFVAEGDYVFENCEVENVTISGIYGVGGISGIAHYGNTISEVSADNVSVISTNNDPENNRTGNIGLIVGAVQGTEAEPSIIEDISIENTTANVTYTDGTTEQIFNIYGTNMNGSTPVTNYVAQIVGGTQYTSVIEALQAAIDTEASELVILKDVREKMTVDFDLVINADLTITAEKPVKVEFYNEGTTRDFAVGSTNDNTLTIAENVHFDLTDRVIWLGYYGNNVDVVVNGYLGGYQIWHGADTEVTATGKLDSHGEAFIMRRNATLTVEKGEVNANYFQIYSGHIEAEDATITAGLVWINNNHSYGSEGTVSMSLDNTTFTSRGEVKVYAGEGKQVPITLTNGTTFTAAGALTTGENVIVKADATSEFIVKGKSIFVAETGGYKYPSLATAIGVAEEDATITVLQNITLAETATIPAGKVVTLDLNGYTISQEKVCTGNYNMIYNKGTLTIKGNGKIRFKDTGAGDPNFGWGSYTLRNEGTLVVENGTIEHLGEQNPGNGQPNRHMYCAIFQYSGSTTINGGTISTPTYRSARLWKGNMTINGGSFEGQLWVQAVDNSAELTINGGTFAPRGNDGASVFVSNSTYYVAFAVTGGTFDAKIGASDVENAGVKGAITGGTFDDNTTDAKLLAEGFEFVFNGENYTVKQTSGTQTREFTKGWNWFSSYVNLSTNDPTNNGLEKLETALGTSGIQIKGQTNNQSATYEYLGKDENGNELYGWIGSFTPSMGKMYMVKTSAPVTGQITGDFVPENTAIALNKGWNWISYPLNVEVEINEALKHLEPEEGDVIKMYGSGFAEYYKGKWYPAEGIETLKPGLGYMYKSAKSTSFVYSADEVVTTTSRSDDKAIDYRWTSEASEYAFNMSVIATLNVDGEMMSGGYEIAAFANGECRGSARPIYIERLDQYMLFLTIYGDEVEELTFKCYDVNYGTEYELSNRFNYSSDAVLGSMAEPYMFNMNFLNIEESSLDMINIYPNPTTTDRAINLQATCDNVEVFNALGVKVAEYQNVDTIDALETAGVYVIRVTINGETRNCRLVVK